MGENTLTIILIVIVVVIVVLGVIAFTTMKCPHCGSGCLVPIAKGTIILCLSCGRTFFFWEGYK